VEESGGAYLGESTQVTYAHKKKILEGDIISHVNDYGIDVESREIFLFPREEYVYGGGEEALPEPGIDFSVANQFIRNLRILTNASTDPILIHLKSSGGDWIEGLAMYMAIKSCPNYVTILNYASARSMSSIVFSAADHRAMLPYSTFMVHTGTACLVGTGTQVHTEYEENVKADKIMLDIYVEKLREAEKFEGWTDKRIRTWLIKKMKEKEEVYFTAEEAIEHNFADSIFGEDGVYDWTTLVKK